MVKLLTIIPYGEYESENYILLEIWPFIFMSENMAFTNMP